MSNVGISTFSIGGILVRGAEVLRRNLAPFGTLSASFMLPPFVLGLMLGTGTGRLMTEAELQAQFAAPPIGIGALILLWILLWILLYFLLFATLTHGTICDLRGTPARIGNSLNWSLGRLLPVIGIIIVATVAIVLTFMVTLLIVAIFNLFSGFNIGAAVAGTGMVAVGAALIAIMLFAPGLMLVTMWWVAVSASVVERTGIFASLRRSAELTRGYRWKVFGVIVVIYTGQFALDQLTNVILASAPIFSLVASFLVTVAVTAYFAVVTAVCYHDLRILKHDVGIDDIARVFD